MTRQQQELQRYSPASIRNEVFTHRMRGLDEEEVREYLGVLADQVQSADAQREAQRSEIERLRAENDRLREESERASTEISPQAVALFSQAQQVADELVEEAVVHARDLMMSARTQQRDILQRAHEAEQQTVRRTGAAQVQAPSIGYTTPVPEVEYVRTFARVAQVQLRSVLDALAEQVDRLGEVPRLDQQREDLGSTAPPWPHSGAGPDHLSVGVRVSDQDDAGGSRIYEQIWSLRGRAVE